MLSQLAFLAAALFTGAALYINLVEHPARMGLPDAPLLAQWKPAYKRGTAMQAPLAVIGFLLAAAAWWFEDRDWRLLAGGVAMLANWPWTYFVILPTNNRLMATPAENAGPETRAMIGRWNRLHAGRTALGALACALIFAALCC
jgi:hypothetical protein